MLSGRRIFSGISFEIGEGETALLTGKTGSGKTTLGIASCGYLPMWAGDWAIDGKIRFSGEELAQGDYRSDVGIVFDEPYSQISGMKKTVEGELAFPLECKGINPSDISAEIKKYSELFNLCHLMESDLRTLSGGELQRVVVAAALIGKPGFLFLDRFLTEIDTEFRKKLMQIVSQYISNSGGVLIAAEDPWLLPEYEFSHCLSLGEEPSDPDYQSLQPLLSTCNPSEKPLLEISSLSFGYEKRRKILDNFSLSVSGGEIILLKGQNGAGKTTLAKILSGLLKPQNGSIILDGQSYSDLGEEGVIPLVGFALQNPELQLCRKTVREEFLLGQRWGNSFGDIAEILGLNSKMDSHPYELTHAEKKRLGIALAYGTGKKLIILDEPTQYQDGDGFMVTATTICRMASQGKSVIVISHDPRFEFAFPDIRTVELSLNS